MKKKGKGDHIIDFITIFLLTILIMPLTFILFFYFILYLANYSIENFVEFFGTYFFSLFKIFLPFSFAITSIIFIIRIIPKDTSWKIHKKISDNINIDTRLRLKTLLLRIAIISSFIILIFLFYNLTRLQGNPLVLLIILPYLLLWFSTILVNNYELSVDYFEKFLDTKDNRYVERGLMKINEILDRRISLESMYNLSHLMSSALVFEEKGKIEIEINNLINTLKKETPEQLSQYIVTIQKLSQTNYKDLIEILTKPKIPLKFKISKGIGPFLLKILPSIFIFTVLLIVYLILGIVLPIPL